MSEIVEPALFGSWEIIDNDTIAGVFPTNVEYILFETWPSPATFVWDALLREIDAVARGEDGSPIGDEWCIGEASYEAGTNGDIRVFVEWWREAEGAP